MITTERYTTEQRVFVPENQDGLAWDHTKAIVHSMVQAKSRIGFEAPPLYLYPNTGEEYATQRWESPALRNGWRFSGEIIPEVKGKKVTHFILIDDFNNVPDGVEERHHLEQLFRLKSVPELASSDIFISNGHEVVRRLESEFVQDGKQNRCSNLDASFQREKIIFQAEPEEGIPLLDAMNETLLIVVHPDGFQQQQSLMLTALLGELKHPPFHQIPKSKRREVLSDMYRHVWFGNEGSITSVTKPVWDGFRFVHEEVA